VSAPRRPAPATLAARALGRVDEATGAVAPPIAVSTNYEREADGGWPEGRSYARDRNPTAEHAEALLAELEGAAEARLFASGMAAATCFFEALLRERGPRPHVVAPTEMYWSLRGWLEERAALGLLEISWIPSGDAGALARALQAGRSALVWAETPSNPTCAITDLAETAECAHRAGALLAVDGTVATPVLTRPLALGADVVMHSASKQLNGHGDVLAGALVTARRDALWEAIGRERTKRGPILGPFEAWLLLRGLRTLYLRVPASAAGALRVAGFLAGHPAVAEVFYPGLPSHPRHEVAARQMRGGFGPLLSFRLRAGEAEARAVARRLRHFSEATSLGGVESLVEHRASVEGPPSALPPDLLRLSIGIEDPADLIADLEQALAGAERPAPA
jgi:cystathionine gamma-synthase